VSAVTTGRYARAVAPVALSAARHVAIDALAHRLAGPSLARSRRRFQSWCRAACGRLGVTVEARGALADGPCILVANHRSYLDIVVLGSVFGAAFLSRADVRDWRVVGKAARAIGCVFIDRDDVRSRARAVRRIASTLHDASLIVFPEGTTGGAERPGPFADGVFRLLTRFDAPAVPVTLRYSDARAYWVEELSMADHLREHVLREPLHACVHVGAPLRSAPGRDASTFAAAVHHAVCEPIEEEGELFVPGGLRTSLTPRAVGR
jgi:1-acyl-sn-glycerol-3-phosphate acyltransferase